MKPQTEEEAREFLDLYAQHTCRDLSAKLNRDERTLRRWRQDSEAILGEKAKKAVPDGHVLKGRSTLYDGQGNVKQEWVKTDRDLDKAKEALFAAVEAMKEDIPAQSPIEGPEATADDLLSCYVITDYHFGQLSWGEETGEDWDVDIATDLLIRWFASAIQQAPKSHTAVLAQLGDFLHYDGLEALTPASGHILDADSRFPKIVNMVIKVLRTVINMLLEKHEHVHIIMAEGNHDLASSVWLRALFAEKYADEPRVTVDNTHTPYYAYEWGQTSLFFHHGHKKAVGNISPVFAAMFRDLFGRTKYSYAHLGHKHHKEKEDGLMVVEQHQTLAAKDAYSSRGGWLSQRGAKVITYSKQYGEQSHVTIRPESLI